MKISEQDLIHGLWMLENQINSPFELVALWSMFPRETWGTSPSIEDTPDWRSGLEGLV